eukprot:456541-Hanusia_phi.AAC.1
MMMMMMMMMRRRRRRRRRGGEEEERRRRRRRRRRWWRRRRRRLLTRLAVGLVTSRPRNWQLGISWAWQEETHLLGLNLRVYRKLTRHLLSPIAVCSCPQRPPPQVGTYRREQQVKSLVEGDWEGQEDGWEEEQEDGWEEEQED